MPRYATLSLQRRGYARSRGDQLVFTGAKVTAAATSESEYVALAEVVNDLRFLLQLQAFMMPPLDLNINIHEDNEGAIKNHEQPVQQPAHATC